MTVALILLGLGQAALLTVLVVVLKRHDTERAQDRAAVQVEREAHAAERAVAHPDLTALIELVDRCCQRIQAPEQAVIDHTVTHLPEIPAAEIPVALDLTSDRDYWERIHALSKDELAENLTGSVGS